jgi:4-alpha-glucanotransferase
MTRPVRLVLTLHNHQPIGNFEGVFENAYRDSYLPFLELLAEFPELKIVLHTSGSLMEWLVAAHPEYIDRLRGMVANGQVELLGGPFFEPILAAIPRRDRVGQIASYKTYLEQLFDTPVRGMWVPERVWEQSFAGDIADGGMEFTLLDDSHFRNAGLADDDLHGYYLTEDGGKALKVFAGSERLRYLIPYSDPQEIINYCRNVGERFANAVLVFGDDGEKFGVWPGSKDHVYHNGWLRRFFTALRDNLSWLSVTTLSESIDHVAPLGRQYLPDASYREMMEWALPSVRQQEYHYTLKNFEHHHDWWRLKQFVRAGFWRNFLVKYPESNEMYSRMLQVSRRLEKLEYEMPAPALVDQLKEARAELYRGQCNCPYWHGAFGGLYLPHLRNAIYGKLISAENHIDAALHPPGSWVSVEADDFNLDARKELKLASDQLIAFVSPAVGGHLYELDVRGIRHNLLATLNRRPEPYHDKIRENAGKAVSTHGGGVDPNGGVAFKHPDLDKKLTYDTWPRKSLVDHFLQPGLSPESFMGGEGCLSDFATGVYQTTIKRSPTQVECRLSRTGLVGPYEVTVNKTIQLSTNRPRDLVVHYKLTGLPAGFPWHFAVEMHFAGMAAGAHDRYFYDARGRQMGMLDARLNLPPMERIGLVDEWLGLDAALDTSIAAAFWTFPIQTVSQSEGGFELVHQSTGVVPRWEFVAPENGEWEVTLTLSLDITAAQAKQLASKPAHTDAQLLVR